MEIEDLRKEIDEVNSEILKMFIRRMEIAEKIALYKKANGLEIFSPEREAAIIKKVRNDAGEKNADAAERLFTTLMSLSRKRQSEVIG